MATIYGSTPWYSLATQLPDTEDINIINRSSSRLTLRDNQYEAELKGSNFPATGAFDGNTLLNSITITDRTTGDNLLYIEGLNHVVANAPETLVVDGITLTEGAALYGFLLAGNDTLHGTTAGDILAGMAGNDVIYGYDGNDWLYGYSGNDTLDGGNGIDVGHFNSAPDLGYNWTRTGDGGWRFVNNVSGSADLLYDIERVQFDDSEAYALDVGIGENGGMAYRIYQAAFARTPDMGGVSYWLDQLDGGMDLIEVAARFIDSAEFRAIYGTQLSNTDYIRALYRNVLQREGEQGGVDFWVGELDRGVKSREKVLADFSESPENFELVGQIIDFGFGINPYEVL